MFAALCMILVALPGAVATAEFDQQFDRIAEEYIAGHLAFRPQTGVGLGFHEYDGKVTKFDRGSIDRELERLASFDKRLDQVPVEKLSDAVKLDYHVLRTAIREARFRIEDLDEYRRHPAHYVRAMSLHIYLSRNFAPLESRVRSIIAIMRQAPQVFGAARANLDKTLGRPLVETAIKVTNGAADFIGNDLPEAVKDLKDEMLRAELKAASQVAIDELRGYSRWLETERLPNATHRVAIGRDRFAKMLRDQEWVTATPEEVLNLGLRELKREQAVFAETARRIDPTKPPLHVFTEIQEDHPTAENLIPDTARNLEVIREFVSRQRIVTIPSEVRVTVAETPAYRRATSFASMDSPGPFEKLSTAAYYYVTPVDQKWTAVQKNEWLTAFNYYTTDVVSIHEAYPGHYVQHLHVNASPISKVRKIFSSYAFVEGWAHYTEQMLLDAGFASEDKLRAAKYRLAQSDEALLRLCRLCCAIQMHCGDMTVDEATKFFQENCYYQEQPARQEATRGTHDPGYLNYALGKLMILKLRDDWAKQEGDKYSLQQFHDTMLGQGMPPLPLLRQFMLKEQRLWDEALPIVTN